MWMWLWWLYKSRRKQAEQIKLMTSYHSLFENMPIVYLKQQLVYDSAGKIVDYITVEANPALRNTSSLWGRSLVKEEVKQIRKVLKGCVTSIVWSTLLKKGAFIPILLRKYRQLFQCNSDAL